MAVGEARQQVTAAKGGNIISQVSRSDGTAQDVYYGLDNSFQYSENINTDDELHGIKLATKAYHTNSYAKCHLVSLGDHGVMALPVDTNKQGDEIILKRFQFNGSTAQTPWEEKDSQAGTSYSYTYDAVEGVVFQNRYWFGSNRTQTEDHITKGYITSVPLTGNNDSPQSHGSAYQDIYLPYDHDDYTDESIEDASTTSTFMDGAITAILNYNNMRLVVACGQDIWVYYPELDHGAKLNDMYGVQGWKKVLTYEAGITVVALTCTFEYLKVRAVDEGWNTKVYYYQGNNNLRSTFVYNLVDLTGVHVLHVYSINGIDYYTSSISEYAEDALIDFNKLIGATPVKLFSQRAGMVNLDINFKAPYFVGPTSMSGAYNNGHIYVADAYGIFSFKYNPNGFDKGYMKWKLRDEIIRGKQVYGLCENKGFLYVSDSDGCRVVRLYDTGIDGYQEQGILISKEFEGREGGTVTKMLDEVRMNFELNPLTSKNGDVDVFVSPNNTWKSATALTNENNRYHVMHIDQESAGTRTEKSNLFNDLGKNKESAFKFDWQTITYAIRIKQKTGDEPKATPIVRQLDLKYHCKDKVNNVYDIN